MNPSKVETSVLVFLKLTFVSLVNVPNVDRKQVHRLCFDIFDKKGTNQWLLKENNVMRILMNDVVVSNQIIKFPR